jgi:hypothetical protein
VTQTPEGGQALESGQTPESGIAETLHDLSDQTRVLVRREVNSAMREMWQKAKPSGPAIGLLAASSALAVFAAASSYRLSLRLLEKRLSPAAAATAATLGYGAAAAGAGVLGVRLLQRAPLPLPTETAQEAKQAVTEVNREQAANATSQAAETTSQAAKATSQTAKTTSRAAKTTNQTAKTMSRAARTTSRAATTTARAPKTASPGE